MRMVVRRSVRVAAVLGGLVLAACSGGGSGAGSGGGGTAGPGSASFAKLVEENATFFRKYNSDGTLEDNVTPPAAMPRTGKASYTGSALVWAGEDISGELDDPKLSDLDAAGRMRMTADLGAGKVKGSIGEFRAPAGARPVSGEMPFDGTISGSAFRASSSGRMTLNGKTEAARGVLMGSFIGKGAAEMTGLGSGNVGASKEYFLIFTGQKVK